MVVVGESDWSVVAPLVMVPVVLPSVFEAVMVLPLLSVVGLSDLVSVAEDLLSVAEVSVADDVLSVAEAEALSCVLVACAVFEL